MAIFAIIATLCLDPQKPDAQVACQKFYVNCMGELLYAPDTLKQEERLKQCILNFKSF